MLDFNNLDFIQIKNKLDEIAKIGIHLEEFGQDSFIIRSYPTWIQGDIESSLREILDSYLNVNKSEADDLFKDIAIKQAHKEVSGKIKLSAVEAQNILTKLRKSSDPYHDPEGNLIIVRIRQNEIQKMFKKG